MSRLSSSVGTAALLHCALRASVTGKGGIPVCQEEMEHLEQLPGRSMLSDGITVLNTLSWNRGAVLKVALCAKLGV